VYVETTPAGHGGQAGNRRGENICGGLDVLLGLRGEAGYNDVQKQNEFAHLNSPILSLKW